MSRWSAPHAKVEHDDDLASLVTCNNKQLADSQTQHPFGSPSATLAGILVGGLGLVLSLGLLGKAVLVGAGEPGRGTGPFPRTGPASSGARAGDAHNAREARG